MSAIRYSQVITPVIRAGIAPVIGPLPVAPIGDVSLFPGIDPVVTLTDENGVLLTDQRGQLLQAIDDAPYNLPE